jgi:hypothetical protein
MVDLPASMLRSPSVTLFSTRYVEGVVESSLGRFGFASSPSLRLGSSVVSTLGFEMGILEEKSEDLKGAF